MPRTVPDVGSKAENGGAVAPAAAAEGGCLARPAPAPSASALVRHRRRRTGVRVRVCVCVGGGTGRLSYLYIPQPSTRRKRLWWQLPTYTHLATASRYNNAAGYEKHRHTDTNSSKQNPYPVTPNFRLLAPTENQGTRIHPPPPPHPKPCHSARKESKQFVPVRHCDDPPVKVLNRKQITSGVRPSAKPLSSPLLRRVRRPMTPNQNHHDCRS